MTSCNVCACCTRNVEVNVCFTVTIHRFYCTVMDYNIILSRLTMVLVFTVDEVLQKGLVLIGFDRYRQQSVSRVTNLVRFRAHFGSDPVVYAQIWEDLQMIPDGNNDHPKQILIIS